MDFTICSSLSSAINNAPASCKCLCSTLKTQNTNYYPRVFLQKMYIYLTKISDNKNFAFKFMLEVNMMLENLLR